jgi:plasmid maintenance system antidote protein VapI
MKRLASVTPGEILLEEFLRPMGLGQSPALPRGQARNAA